MNDGLPSIPVVNMCLIIFVVILFASFSKEQSNLKDAILELRQEMIAQKVIKKCRND